MRTIFVLFGGYQKAAAAVEELIGKGFGLEEMNFVAQTTALRPGARSLRLAGKGRPSGMDTLISGCKWVKLPGAGEACAAGRDAQEAAAATEEGQGTSLADVLSGIGVPEELAELYEGSLAEGGLLFWVHVAEGRFEEASGVLAGAMDRKVANYN